MKNDCFRGIFVEVKNGNTLPKDNFPARGAQEIQKELSTRVNPEDNKTKLQNIEFIILSGCIYHIFKRAIAQEVKSNAMYLLYGFNTCRKNITVTYLESNRKNSDKTKSCKQFQKIILRKLLLLSALANLFLKILIKFL